MRGKVRGRAAKRDTSPTSTLPAILTIYTSYSSVMVYAAVLLLAAAMAAAHGDHSFDLNDAADDGMSYAERHVSLSRSPLFQALPS
jgi:hypothetical protein